MEARASYRSTGISRGFVAFVLVIVAVSIVIVAAFAASSLATTGSNAQSTLRPAAGTVLRQDNPPAQQVQASYAAGQDACIWSGHHKGC